MPGLKSAALTARLHSRRLQLRARQKVQLMLLWESTCCLGTWTELQITPEASNLKHASPCSLLHAKRGCMLARAPGSLKMCFQSNARFQHQMAHYNRCSNELQQIRSGESWWGDSWAQPKAAQRWEFGASFLPSFVAWALGPQGSECIQGGL